MGTRHAPVATIVMTANIVKQEADAADEDVQQQAASRQRLATALPGNEDPVALQQERDRLQHEIAAREHLLGVGAGFVPPYDQGGATVAGLHPASLNLVQPPLLVGQQGIPDLGFAA